MPDDLDWRIIERLETDGRATNASLAEALGVAEGTVRSRLKKLIEKGILRVSGLVNPEFLQNYQLVLIGMNVAESRRLEQTASAVSQLPQVRSVAITSGRYDLMVEVLAYNFELHNALAGIELRPIKKQRTLTRNQEIKAKPIETTPDLLAKEKALWLASPPINSHTRYVYGMGSNDSKSNWPNVGVGGMSARQAAAKYGSWEWRRGKPGALLENKKLGLVYTMADYRAGKPLPDPYPFKDYGWGIFTPARKEGEKPQNLWPVPEALGRRMRGYARSISKLVDQYKKGNMAAGREAAFRLVRVAYNLPSIEARNSMHSVLVQPGSWGRDHGCRRRDPMRAEIRGERLLPLYDALFDLVKADKGLAESIGRFIPWVRSTDDVTALLDAYLVQNEARRILRYHVYSSNTPHKILGPANVLGDNSVSKPWLDWLFSVAFIYPLPPAGVQDLVVSANARNGMGYIGSHFYAHGEQAAPIATYLDSYIDMGGLPQYNLGDPKMYPKPLAACHWFFDSRAAGNKGFRLWEYGVGDEVRQSTKVGLRRTGDKTYQVTADTGLTVTFKGGKARTITVAELVKNGGKLEITAP